MSNTVSFIVRLPTRPEKRAQMRAMLFDVVDAMSHEPDFVNTWVHEDVNDPDAIVLYETWACTQDYFMAHHLAKPYRAAYEAALPELLSGERSLQFLSGIRAYPQRAL